MASSSSSIWFMAEVVSTVGAGAAPELDESSTGSTACLAVTTWVSDTRQSPPHGAEWTNIPFGEMFRYVLNQVL